ncbi:MAG: Holliday junction branch migration protein RuvA [Peptococcaceae bacterium]|jgi:Holliday junction DNA helicase RuvA|nr:Holliday junction branch migration protein RuvA [Peptococcaceae bacterium]
MIGILRGKVWEIEASALCLDVAGVGYEIAVTASVLGKARMGQELTVYTKLIPKDDELALYGFATLREKQLFLEMLTVSGIGPKGALSLLSALGVDQIETAFAAENAALLTKVPGIGKKTAQRLILELKEKFKGLPGGTGEGSLGSLAGIRHSDALESLLVLGYTLEESQRTLAAIVKEQPESTTEEQIKLALRTLSAR